MTIDTDKIDEYCESRGCNECSLANEDGECTYRSFMEQYECAQYDYDFDDDDYNDDPLCNFCERPIKKGQRKVLYTGIITPCGEEGVYVCTKCFNKFRKYRIDPRR